jgi:hypothetical protein
MQQIKNATNRHFAKVLVGLLLLTNTAISQYNLVPNSSFEDYTICPQFLNNYLPIPWYNACKRIGSYCNACSTDDFTSVPKNFVGSFSYQNEHTGYGYSLADFLYSGERTYIQVKLKDSLRFGKKYYGEYFVNIPNPLKLACNNIEMLFTNAVIYSDPNRLTFNPIIANAQVVNYGNPIINDTLNWIKVSGIFTAQGGEQYLTLGNFKTDAATSYKVILPSSPYAKASYYIDDVSVIPLDSMCLKADAGRDSTIKVGDSVFIGCYTNGIDTVKWFNGNIVIDSVQPGFWVKPTATTSYVLQQVVNGCFSSDTVVVTVKPLPLKMVGFTALYQPPLTPPQEGNVLLQWQTANEVNVSHYNIQRSVNGKDFTTIGKIKANNRSSNEYSFTDKLKTEALDGKTVYYRIVGVDFDGQKQYSQVKSVALKVNNCITLSVYF